MRALVTGGAGFIGSTLVDALVAEGHAVAVLDDLSTGSSENLESALAGGAELTVGSVTDQRLVTRLVAASRPHVVFHLAAQVSVSASVADASFDEQVNVGGTVNVLTAAAEHGAEGFVNASSGGALYADPVELPTPEGAPVRPISPYGQSKHAAEGYCRLFERLHGLPTACLRLANVYGSRQPVVGESAVIAAFSLRIAEGRAPSVNGTGEQTRDFVHVDDVVNAFLAAARTRARGAINVGTGVETSVLGLLGLMGVDLVAARFEPPRPGEVFRSALDWRLANEALGWRPQVDIQEGVGRLLAGLPKLRAAQ